MKLGILFSGGKDSTYAAYIAKQQCHELTCLISIFSQNQESYMFHTPNIELVKKQAKVMELPILIETTKGEKEKELVDLKKIIKNAKEKYSIQGIVTGALHSDYQASRIQKICDDLNLECINPLWHKDEIQYLEDLVKNNFKIIIVGVFAYPLNQTWLGKIIDKDFIEQTKQLKQKYKIHPAGEGGEFETLVLDCPLFKKELQINSHKDFTSGENSWKKEIQLK